MSKIHETVFIGKSAVITGNVEIGEECGVWHNATIRGDQAPIRIGERTNIQDNAVVHVSVGFPTTIGNDVTIGHSAIIHGCTIEDGALIGMGAIVMNGAHIGKNCTIGAGSLVTQGTDIPDNSLAFGNPCRIKRECTEDDLAAAKRNAAQYVELAREAKAAKEQG